MTAALFLAAALLAWPGGIAPRRLSALVGEGGPARDGTGAGRRAVGPGGTGVRA